MLSIPDDFPLSALRHQELTQVCIGRHHVRLNFYALASAPGESPRWEPGAAIDIEAGFELCSADGTSLTGRNEDLGSMAGCLTSLLGESVDAVERLQKNELLITFSNRSKLRLLTDPVGFESYHLHVAGDSVDVTTSGGEL